MKNFTLSVIAFLFILTLGYSQNPITNGSNWTVTYITNNDHLNNPNTIKYGPDGNLWITERVGKRLVRFNPNGTPPLTKATMLNLGSGGLNKVYQSAGQDGLMGFAIHPDLYENINTTTNNYVYLAYTYDNQPGSGVTRKLRIERYTYNSSNGTLNSTSGTTILEDIDASYDHNSGKLLFGPDSKLYYTSGDLGANQFDNACIPHDGQNLPTSGGQTATTGDKSNYHGKILRINLDGTVPSDNPTLNGFKSHVYTYGHRNPQGIAFGSDGKLYSSEHGPKVDDELNIIESGKDYGYPLISGYFDDNYQYCNWAPSQICIDSPTGWKDTDNTCPAGVIPLSESDSYPSGPPANFMPPIGTY